MQAFNIKQLKNNPLSILRIAHEDDMAIVLKIEQQLDGDISKTEETQ